jgi:hypothetical protein
MKRFSYANVAATIALVLALSGGAVYAAGKIGPKQIKQNAVKSKHIAEGAVGTGELAEGAVGTGELAESAVGTGELAGDAATGAKILESSLGSVPQAARADAVGGISLEPASIALADTSPDMPEVVNVGGSRVIVGCSDTGVIVFETTSTTGSPPIVGEFIRNGLSPVVALGGGGAGQQVSAAVLGFTGTVREASGRVTRVQLAGFYQANAYGGPQDCFAQGTIQRFG